MWVRLSVSVLLLLALWHTGIGQEGPATEEEEAAFPCHSLSRDNYTCGECVRFHTSCAWCKKPGYDEKSQLSRCDSIGRLIDNGCGNEGDYVNPKTQSVIKGQMKEELIKDNVELRRQLFPESVRVKLRPMDSFKFNIIYRQVKNYPVDLYYLMDLSNSMEDDRNKITELGDLLAARMSQITKNFQLGFGSFVDKKLIPFVDPRPERRDRPCTTCEAPYGFNHEMTLTTNTTLFKNKVKAAQISGNLDGPEGGFDAIMQALVCPEIIGWREKSRKMVVFSTDAGFHFAGDGRLAGVVTPNDGECHMEQVNGNKWTYTMSDHQDYPSISQLHEKIRAAQANVIFAVTEKQVGLYDRLKDALPDVSASVGTLADDSNNIVELITQEYEKIAEKLIMVDNLNATQGLRLSYKTKCKGSELLDTNVCDEVKLGENIMWEVTLQHVSCVDQKQFRIDIGPSGLSEHVTLDVYVDCDCPCENDNSVVRNSAACSRSGDLKCGVCDCAGGAVGRSCECTGLDVTTSQLDAKCKQFNESEICSGRGECQCGVCQCNKRPGKELITGKFCQCDNFDCPRHHGQICNGQGTCECKACQCKPGWKGYACDCPVSQAACIDDNGKMCSGHGECVCGQCKCDERYSGPHCDTCTTCPTKCLEYRPCVMCKGWASGPYNETQCADENVCPWVPIIVEELPERLENDTKIGCQFIDPADDCTFYFVYDYNEELDNVTVWIQRDKECPPPVPILAIVLGLIAGIVLIGLILLLVWKLLTLLHDRREYAMFEQERLMAKWDTGENPIFQPATSTFKNPLFAGGRQ